MLARPEQHECGIHCCPVATSDGGAAGASGVVLSVALDQRSGRCEHVVRAALVRGSEILAQELRGSARPKEEADAQADCKADGYIFETNQPDRPADGLDEVEEDEQDDG